ncbi:hypothetical protein NCG97_18250 [Streptomyces lydicamycinicus]|uniref:hypothetical protein n=1 Tax=Streptomyces lydicamycinicus TaxID=1546107 RepID=UPI002034A9F4|nr:hypothetical protein [Streptomyces lydicamycinicus]USA02166.1 hypothetical protein NCG97_18250 [Streptomyces lydicamycinicus]
MAFGELLTLALLTMAVLGMTGAGLGIYALICNRVPGRWLGKTVRNPRLWGIGMLFMVSSLAFVSWTPLIIGLGITVTGHAVKPTG